MAGKFFYSTCLRPTYSLQRQLAVAYGGTALILILSVVILATLSALHAGDVVTKRSKSLLRDQLIEGLLDASKETGDLFTKKFSSLRGTAALLTEIVRDRIVGYPDEFADDRYVPFVDMETGRNAYPLRADLLPRDFEVVSNWDASNFEEHAQDKPLQGFVGIFSSSSAFFTFQGNCNPLETDEKGAAYFPNCTNAHNDASLGGMVYPSPTLAALEQKAADISVFMKALWEAEPSAVMVSVYFHNSGAGATVSFPSLRGHSSATYVSGGCDWMKQRNPYTNEPFGTQEQINRCRAAGDVVPIREYNPMEREFCHDQILHPGESRIYGPYLDSIWGQWRLTVGQAVFDRETGHFIACTGIDLNLALASDLLDSVIAGARTKVAVVRLDGSVVAGAGLSPSSASQTETVHILDTGFIDTDSYVKLTTAVDWDEVWDPEEIKTIFASNYCQGNGNDDDVLSVIPSPFPPDVYDPLYRPDFYVVVTSMGKDVFGISDQMRTSIEHDVSRLIVGSILIGSGGLLFLLVVVWFVSRVLTRPLNYMEQTSWKIVNHTDHRVTGEGLALTEAEQELDALVRCSPKTEISELVSEFQVMIQGFSGIGASRVAASSLEEIKNIFTWKDEFRQLYDLNPMLENKLEAAREQAMSVTRRLSSCRRLNDSTASSGGGGHFSTGKGFGPSVDLPGTSSVLSNYSDYDEENTTFRSAEMKLGSNTNFGSPARPKASKMKHTSTRTNFGSNLPNSSHYRNEKVDDSVRISRSSLFRWVLGAIAVPLLVTNIVICSLVARQLLNSFPELLQSGKDISYKLEEYRLKADAALSASQGEQVLPSSLRDLYLLTRVSGWLLFGAVGRSDSFTSTELEFLEECKSFVKKENGTCPFFLDETRSPCDCAWNDPWRRQCTNLASSRRLQRAWFMCQARDFDPITGSRTEAIGYPRFDSLPEDTCWWDNVTDMPGAFAGSNASGYETTYDRLRVISALSSVSLPLYNYVNNDRHQTFHTSMSSYVAFEADGGYWGFAGCNYDFASYSGFKSSAANMAFAVNQDLCPVGKYGYDPRCRQWYDDTKVKAINGGPGIHVTAPYTFATVKDVGSSAVSPLVDKRNGAFVGTALIDFPTSAILPDSTNSTEDFRFVLSPAAASDGDAVLGPFYPIGSPPRSIVDVVLPHDGEDSEHRKDFSVIVERMKSGDVGEEKFTRTLEDGQEQTLMLSFAPVYARVLDPVQPDDFSRGATVSRVLLYSIGKARADETLMAPFRAIKGDISENLKIVTIIYLCSVAVVTFFCVVVTAKISIAVTGPVLILLRIVQRVNAGRIEDDMPPLTGGSREVHQVYTSFAKLYKIVGMSNVSYYSGDFKWAHHIANDALSLFRKIGDQKAVAIACNNIGNTLLALSVKSREKGACMKSCSECCLKIALDHFEESIRIGTAEFQGTDSDAEKAEFAQQLGDRHFNRAMCILHFLDDPCCAIDASDQALTDLHRSREYDRGVHEYFLHERLTFRYSDILFERLLRRIHGLAILYSFDARVWQVWNVNDLVDQADLMLQAAWDQENAPVFRNVTKVGRLQQLEGAVIGLEMATGNIEDAARLAMRMMVEDDFVLDHSFAVAADSILRFMREPKQTPWADTSIRRTRAEFRRMRKFAKRTALEIGRSFVFCFEICDKWSGTSLRSSVNEECVAFYEEQCNGRDSIGLVALSNSVDSNLIMKLGTKDEAEPTQREAIDEATRQIAAPSSYPALPTAVNMVVEAARVTANDVFLIYVTDGCTWDARSFSVMRKKIEGASRRRNSSIDVITIGLETIDPEFCENCRNLCLATRSRNSKFLTAHRDTVDEAFESVASVISSSTSSASSRIHLAATMERF